MLHAHPAHLRCGDGFVKEAQIAIETATQLAKSAGEDMAIMSDLSVKPLRFARGATLEIVRCPESFKKRPANVD